MTKHPELAIGQNKGYPMQTWAWFRASDETGDRFRLDVDNQCLLRQASRGPDHSIDLTPKAFGVLKYLVSKPGRLIIHDDFLNTVWPGVYVQPDGLKNVIMALRAILGDDARNPRFIQSVPRRGYRFIARVSGEPIETAFPCTVSDEPLVGRERRLSELNTMLQRAMRQKQREIVFVTGESGIGKTSLADAFLRRVAQALPHALIARGQCVEGHGGREAFYPLLEALHELCRGERAGHVLKTVAASAPSWLVEFPSLLQPAQRPSLAHDLTVASPERRMRELRDVCDQLAQTAPLVLVLEDLQWVDPSTVDFIEVLARARAPMSMMLIGTYRPCDEASGNPALRALHPELQLHRLCSDIRLEPLTEDDIQDYLTRRNAAAAAPAGLARLIHQHTEGNPLFMVTLLEHFCQRGLLSTSEGSWQLQAPLEKIDIDVPESLRGMIEARITRLPTDKQRALEVASVVGMDFEAQQCANAAGLDAEAMEALCDKLADQHFILTRLLPVGALQSFGNTGPSRYRFVHTMYREVLFWRQPPARRTRLQAQIDLPRQAAFASQPECASPCDADRICSASNGRFGTQAIDISRICRNRSRGTTTSAIWKITERLPFSFPEPLLWRACEQKSGPD